MASELSSVACLLTSLSQKTHPIDNGLRFIVDCNTVGTVGYIPIEFSRPQSLHLSTRLAEPRPPFNG
jgi:hypothetical protein